MRENITSLTSLRGIAALLIVIHHYVSLTFDDLGTAISQYTHFIENSYLMVDFFFILSGFVLALVYHETFSEKVNKTGYRTFLFARFSRIYPLHIFILFTFLAIELLDTGMWLAKNGFESYTSIAQTDGAPFTGSHSPDSLIANVFLVQAWTIDTQFTSWNHPSWSISTEWFVYLFVPALLLAGSKVWKKAEVNTWFFLLAAGIPLLGLYQLSLSTQWQLDVAGIHGLIRCFLEAWLGILTYRVYQSKWRAELWKHTALLVGSLVWIVFVMHFNISHALAIPAFVLLILSISHSQGTLNRFLNWRPAVFMGEISYSIYMTHILILTITARAWWMLYKEQFGADFTIIQSSATLLAGLLLVITVSFFSHRLVEIPAQKWLKNRQKMKAS